MSTSIAKLDGQARERLIVWIQHRMHEFGITVDALERALAEDEAARATRYQDALGHVWDGRGDMPDWLRRAVASGQSIEFFRCG
ncbi:H-NS histone family protein [Paraburkholderia sp. LEh10]|uniref:H-NS family nucleoid-associated regulatory protein n=1 Tax=Paraburkholderia sp. LEh10 TaxID=2821353 RepID=UPI001AE77F6F|nr:H-NS family nucleoid-associated regulatory protein [Paraburkholderia sp. LEh10]MBP0591949.1 H-NS histone family protein [Paraburkholderia sp. LEh10]